MAKVAVESERSVPTARRIASGEGWAVSDLVCAAGPRDRPFEEQHSGVSIAIVMSGSFQYRSAAGCELMTPGSLLLGNDRACFSCGHEHGSGDRCLSFSYAPELFEGLASDGSASGTRFGAARLPPVRPLASLIAKAAELLTADQNGHAETLAIQLATEAIRMATGNQARRARVEPSSLARVTRVVRMIESDPDEDYDLKTLAQVARLSPYHFLRTFVEAVGVTPHQYLLRSRLRRAALSLKSERTNIVDIALNCGFRDISNFNRAFRAEFGVSPRICRSRHPLAIL